MATDFATAKGQLAAIIAALKVFGPMEEVLSQAVEAQAFLATAPAQREALRVQLVELQADVAEASAQLEQVRSELDAARDLRDGERAKWQDEQRRHLESQEAQLAQIATTHGEKVRLLEAKYVARKGELEAELAAIQVKVDEAKALRDRLKNL